MIGIGARIAGVAIGTVLLASCATLAPGNSAAPAASLAGLRLEVPCANPKFTQDTECHWDPKLLQTADPQWKLKREIVRTFGGKPGTTYQVTLHVRGVVEPKNFTGGIVQLITSRPVARRSRTTTISTACTSRTPKRPTPSIATRRRWVTTPFPSTIA